MKIKIIIGLLISIFIIKMNAQNNLGITPQMLDQIKTNFAKKSNNRALMNAISSNEIKKLSQNNLVKGKADHTFSNKVKTKGITDQKSSGRCWMFTSMNSIRPKVILQYDLNEFEFSYNYSFFWDQLEKSNLFLEATINNAEKPFDDKTVEWLFKNPIGDGGVWNLFADITNKYGIIPSKVMPETFNSDNTSAMSRILASKLREDGLKLREIALKNKSNRQVLNDNKTEMLSEIYKILAYCLGEPPSEFIWKYENKDGKVFEREYTPKSFYNEVVGINLSDYVLLMNDPSREYYKLYEIEYDRNMYDGNNWKYVNLPMDKIKEFAKKSIIANEAMYMSCDVGKQLNKDEGILDLNNYDYESLFGIKLGMNKKERIQTFESGSAHAMTLVAVDIDKDGKTKKWQVENSWGATSGNKGYLTMTDEWFDEYFFRLVVHKQYITKDVEEILKTKSIKLPPWDPMFSIEE
ncbi:MAG: aminopeptidase [Bacteroidetes bacterium GWE2_29_8]|nr:MAG: aminopeptidase [Bacteroidetes bacterium GWE2_29_8]